MADNKRPMPHWLADPPMDEYRGPAEPERVEVGKPGDRRHKTWSTTPRLRGKQDTARKVEAVAVTFERAARSIGIRNHYMRVLDNLPEYVKAYMLTRMRDRDERSSYIVWTEGMVLQLAERCLRDRTIRHRIGARERKGLIRLITGKRR